MAYITLNTAASVSGLSKRTLWRRIADKQLRTQGGGDPGEHTRVAVSDVLALSRLHLESEDTDLIVRADGGDVEAQCDLGLLFISHKQPAEAVRWLAQAANKLYPEAMYQLGRCYVEGTGAVADERIGVGWIARAAGFGHIAARQLMRYLEDPARPPLPVAALAAELDAIERRLVLGVLNQSANPV